MILVDSSVWIDYFRGVKNPQTDTLDGLLASEPVAVGDLMLAEVLQGFGSERDFNRAKAVLTNLEQVHIGGTELAVQAARNFRTLRGLGVTVRKTIDVLIATRCIEDDLLLLHSDRDFDAFEQHLGLRVFGAGG
ncbi:type II toxin-antitoxin system VapC family toxin [Stenotrophomonas nitritireducens]|uniref:type II toxin-antitoxin system VapC family toxin n=1 Tax=Stenotrophomonas nitritireducens TaxID=83617 RepID=UPI003D951A17